jgi:putative flippase GtrA
MTRTLVDQATQCLETDEAIPRGLVHGGRKETSAQMPTCAPALIKFMAVGASGMLVDMAVFIGTTAFLSLGIARALGIGVALHWNFFLDRTFAFADCRPRPLWQQYIMFCASCLFGAIANWVTSISLCLGSAWFMAHPAAACLAGVSVGFAFNFVLSRRFVFPPS